MEPNEKNQHFAELRQNRMFIHTRSGALKMFALSLDGKLKHFVTKKWKKQLPNSSQTDYSSGRELLREVGKCVQQGCHIAVRLRITLFATLAPPIWVA